MTILLSMILVLLSSSPAMAARAGSVDVEGTELRQFPDKTAIVLIRLHKGTRLVASNVATLGFHRVRLRSTLVGWVSARALILQPMMSTSAGPSLIGGESSTKTPLLPQVTEPLDLASPPTAPSP